MAATRVRLIAEYRNGDGNYYRDFKSVRFVESTGVGDKGALDAAYLILNQEIDAKLKRESKRESKAANHD